MPFSLNGKSTPRVDVTGLVLIALFLSYLIPGGLVSNNFVAPVMQGGVLAVYMATNLGRTAAPSALLVALSFGLSMICLNALALLVDFNRNVPRDYLELGKYFLIALAFVAGAVMSRDSKIDNKVSLACVIGAVLFAIPGLLETFQGSAAAAIVKSLYGRDLIVLQGKPILSFWTTYFAAAMYAFMASILIGCIVKGQANWLMHVAVYFLMSMILLTQSRAGFLALTILLVAYVASIYAQRMYTLLVLLAFLFALGAALSLLFLGDQIASKFGYLLYGLQNYILGFLDNASGENSLGYRVSQIEWSVDENKNIMVGAGIGKGYQPYLESYLSLFYYRYGVIGIVIHGFIWAFPALYLVLSIACGSRDISSLQIGLGIFCTVLPLISASSVITDQVHFMFVFYLILGIWYGSFFDRYRTPSQLNR